MQHLQRENRDLSDFTFTKAFEAEEESREFERSFSSSSAGGYGFLKEYDGD